MYLDWLSSFVHFVYMHLWFKRLMYKLGWLDIVGILNYIGMTIYECCNIKGLDDFWYECVRFESNALGC